MSTKTYSSILVQERRMLEKKSEKVIVFGKLKQIHALTFLEYVNYEIMLRKMPVKENGVLDLSVPISY